MNTRKMLVSVLILVSVLLAACAPAAMTVPAADTSVPSIAPSVPSVTPRSTPAPTATLDHRDIPPELVGTWLFSAYGKSWTVDLTSEGTFSLYNSDGHLDVAGSYGISGSEAIFRDEIRGLGMLCIPAEGRYSWQLTEDHLVFTVIEDKCKVGRIQQWTAHWTRK